MNKNRRMDFSRESVKYCHVKTAKRQNKLEKTLSYMLLKFVKRQDTKYTQGVKNTTVQSLISDQKREWTFRTKSHDDATQRHSTANNRAVKTSKHKRLKVGRLHSTVVIF